MPRETAGPSLLEAYRRAYLIRHVEEEIARRYHPTGNKSESPMRCPVHLSVGQETIAVGVAMAIEEYELTMHGDDYRGAFWPNGRPHVWFGHRSHAPYLAFGGNLERMLAELYGKATGCSGGVGGSMHLHDKDAGLMGGTPIVGSAVSLATGSAWAAKLEGSNRLTVVFCGDAVPETGQFWESLNFASLHGLRLLYVIEDNGLSTATPKGLRQRTRVDYMLSATDWHDDLGYETFTCEVDDFDVVYAATDASVDAIQSGIPALILVPTTRACAHVGPEIDHEALAMHDPVHDLRVHSMSREEYEQAGRDETAVRERVAAAFTAAEAAPWPVAEAPTWRGGTV